MSEFNIDEAEKHAAKVDDIHAFNGWHDAHQAADMLRSAIAHIRKLEAVIDNLNSEVYDLVDSRNEDEP